MRWIEWNKILFEFIANWLNESVFREFLFRFSINAKRCLFHALAFRCLYWQKKICALAHEKRKNPTDICGIDISRTVSSTMKFSPLFVFSPFLPVFAVFDVCALYRILFGALSHNHSICVCYSIGSDTHCEKSANRYNVPATLCL